MASIISDNKGQIIIIIALIITIILAELSLMYMQAHVSGSETEYTLLMFPKDQIRNLRNFAVYKLKNYAKKMDKLEFKRFVILSNEQLTRLYAVHNSYCRISVGNIVTNTNNKVLYYKIYIYFSNREVKYNDVEGVYLQ